MSRSIQWVVYGDKTEFNWQTAYNYNFELASKEVKNEALDLLNKNNTLPSLSSAVSASLNKSQDDSWIGNLEVIDERRNVNWRESLRISEFY